MDQRQPWIKVETAKPDHSGEVIVVVSRPKGSDPRSFVSIAVWWEGIGKWNSPEGEVTHWMEIPEVPRETSG